VRIVEQRRLKQAPSAAGGGNGEDMRTHAWGAARVLPGRE
jgi:hypothetical protein